MCASPPLPGRACAICGAGAHLGVRHGMRGMHGVVLGSWGGPPVELCALYGGCIFAVPPGMLRIWRGLDSPAVRGALTPRTRGEGSGPSAGVARRCQVPCSHGQPLSCSLRCRRFLDDLAGPTPDLAASSAGLRTAAKALGSHAITLLFASACIGMCQVALCRPMRLRWGPAGLACALATPASEQAPRVHRS